MSVGMDRQTGRRLSDLEHLRQSISVILGTPVGTRVMRRPFGSLLPELIDHPGNDEVILQVYAATATALITHEPRFRLTRIQFSMSRTAPHRPVLDVEGVTREDGEPVSLTIQGI